MDPNKALPYTSQPARTAISCSCSPHLAFSARVERRIARAEHLLDDYESELARIHNMIPCNDSAGMDRLQIWRDNQRVRLMVIGRFDAARIASFAQRLGLIQHGSRGATGGRNAQDDSSEDRSLPNECNAAWTEARPTPSSPDVDESTSLLRHFDLIGNDSDEMKDEDASSVYATSSGYRPISQSSETSSGSANSQDDNPGPESAAESYEAPVISNRQRHGAFYGSEMGPTWDPKLGFHYGE